MAYRQILIHGIQRNECSGETQHLQQRYAPRPLLANGEKNELTAHQCQAEHQRHSQETREAQHLTVDTFLSFLLAAVGLDEHRLRYLSYSVCHKRRCHIIPFVCLRVVANLVYWEQSAEYHRQHVVAYGADNLRHKNLHRKRRHLNDRTQIHGQPRTPLPDVVVAAQIQHGNICHLLPCQRPIAVAHDGKRNASRA